MVTLFLGFFATGIAVIVNLFQEKIFLYVVLPRVAFLYVAVFGHMTAGANHGFIYCGTTSVSTEQVMQVLM